MPNLALGRYRETLPTVNNNKTSELQIDANGRLLVSNGGSGSGVGGSITPSKGGATLVADTNTVIISANTNRVGIEISNMSATDTVYVYIGSAAVVGQGIGIPPQQGWLMDERTYSTASINVISSGTPLVAWLETSK